MLFLLLLFFRSLLHLASLLSFSLFGHVRRVQHGQYSVVVLRRSAWSRSSLFGLAALFCVAWVIADASVNSIVFQRESCIPIPTSTASPLEA